MSELDPVLAIFGLVSGSVAGLTGFAVGPVIVPMLVLLYAGFRVSAS